MGYLINSARPASLIIGSTEYIDRLVSFQVSDASAYRNGIITTLGTIILGSQGGDSLSDYERNDFKRGKSIIFDVTYPSGNTLRHPRGTLKVMSASYSPEEEQVVLEVGCALSMAKLLEDDGYVQPYVSVPLDPVQGDYEGVSSSLAAAGKILWIDSDGNLETDNYFGSDSYGAYEPGAFTSVRGVTALAVQPLTGTGAIPDEIELTYQFPADQLSNDQTGRVDTVTTESTYFLKYPGLTYERINQGTIITITPVTTTPPTITTVSGCGNAVSPPSGLGGSSGSTSYITGGSTTNVQASCTGDFATEPTSTYVAAKRISTSETTYGGPAAQSSFQESWVYGPALEVNSQYYADKFAYCVGQYANVCAPTGGCPLDGQEQALLGRQQTEYFYGEANEVVKQVVTTWRPKLSAMQPTDWRSGIDRGIPQDFKNDLTPDQLYRHQIVTREFGRNGNENVQTTTTQTSSVTRGGGIGGNIDARAGITTKEVRTSSSTITADIKPDQLNSPKTTVETGTSILKLSTKFGGYEPTDGPYSIKEDIPVPLLFADAAGVSSALAIYAFYLSRFIEGDIRGLAVGEALTEEISAAWTPNVPFRYYDPTTDSLMAFRADACSWGADPAGCVVVLNGIWVGDSLGTVTLPDNLVGNAGPDMGSGTPTPPTPPVNPLPVVVDDVITGKTFTFTIEVNLYMGAIALPAGIDGVRPPPLGNQDVAIDYTFVVWCTGRIVQPGAIVSLEVNGSLPLSFYGNPVVDDALIIVGDDVLFPEPT